MSRCPDTPPPYGTVVFDCDSTLSAIEGIDELAALHSIDVRELTQRAMQGEIRLEDVYKMRLERIRPSRASVEAIGRMYVEHMLPHARELVAALRRSGKRVRIVSGGLEPAVSMLAQAAGIEPSEVHSVAMRHGSQGEYLGFDESSPLARSGGKIEVLRNIALEQQDASERDNRGSSARDNRASVAREGRGLNASELPVAVALVGDGVTDLEAVEELGSPARFIAFGGVERRAAVFERAAVTCEKRDLAALVPLLFSRSEIDKLAASREHSELLRAARETT